MDGGRGRLGSQTCPLRGSGRWVWEEMEEGRFGASVVLTNQTETQLQQNTEFIELAAMVRHKNSICILPGNMKKMTEDHHHGILPCWKSL